MAFPHDGVKFKKGGIPNPKGRPRTSFKEVNQYLADAGVKPLGRNELIKTYQMVFNATEQQLSDIAQDPDVPYALRIILAEINDKNRRHMALKDLRDYVFGKATENRNVNISVEQPLFNLTEGKIIDVEPK